MSPQIYFGFRLPVEFSREGKWFIASCPMLDVHSQGTSEAKAKSNLIEAMQLFIESCFERGTLHQVFEESGFELQHGTPRQMPPPKNMIDVPLYLGATANAQAQAN
ncbi:MAG: type II toxin-antitoxin system HicB family antitoxin [Candidatus Neomarinimicrobiota bacterium]